jgi:hypothetical protein
MRIIDDFVRNIEQYRPLWRALKGLALAEKPLRDLNGEEMWLGASPAACRMLAATARLTVFGATP